LEGTELGDWVIESPMEQIVLGIGGVYEFTFVDKPPITMSEFRKRADAHKQQQIGNFLNRVNTKRKDDKASTSQQPCETKENSDSMTMVDDNTEKAESCNVENLTNENQATGDKNILNAEEDIELLERQFWKRIGPTMIPAWYGADQEDTLFYHENEIDHADPTKCNAAATWSLCQLDSCLQVLPPIPGVTSPYLYVGMWGSVFCSHTEDMNLLSINYLHAGSPKLWYSIAEPDAARYNCLAEHYYSRVAGKCKEFLRHKRYLLSPAILQKAGIRYQTAIQYPGDAVITMPGGYHFGFNLGFNVAEATNFGVPEWLPFGREAKVCLCRPDSVRIDMFRLTELIRKFHVAQKRNRRLTFAEWKKKQDWQNRIHGTHTDDNRNEAIADGEELKSKRKRMTGGPLHHTPIGLTEQQRRNEFWIEVMKPVTADVKAGGSKKKRKKTSARKEGNGTGGKDKKKNGDMPGEVWHLAKPINRTSNKIVVNSRVLCIIPASQNLQHINFNGINGDLADGFFNGNAGMQLCNDSVEEQMDEQCFAGQVVEIMDHFARVHLIGLHRTEDIWMSIHNPRLFLDGGQFIFGVHEDIPPLHYWQEMDSKTRLR
jgi:JmjC domain, hydroxylase